MSLLIKNARVITGEKDYVSDVYAERDVISAIGMNLEVGAETIIDGTGKFLIPGGVDIHTHMDLPFGGICSSDDFETGTIAAAHGGTTTIVDFAVQSRGTSMQYGLDVWKAKAEGKCCIDYGFHLILTEFSVDQLAEMDKMVKHEGVTTFKLFTAYPGVYMVDDATILRALKQSADNGALICMHAENGHVVDQSVKRFLSEGKTAPNFHALAHTEDAEEEATRRVITLSEKAGVPIYIVHVSSRKAMEQIRAARRRGTPAFGETCPQYLFLSYEEYSDGSFEGAKYVCSPPIREQSHQEHLWNALETNDLQAVATDHCPFCMKEGFKGLPKQKELGMTDFSKIPNGVPGVENRLHLLYEGGVVKRGWSMNRFVQLVSATPAKLMGLFPRKGTIAVGSDADLVLWDPRRPYTISANTHFMRVDYNLYEGMRVSGSPTTVTSRGKIVFEFDKFTGRSGSGKFIRRGHPEFP